MRENRRLDADLQHLRAQSRIAYEISANAALQHRQSELLGILTYLFARNHITSTQQPATPTAISLPAPLPEALIFMDHVLLDFTPGGTEYGKTASNTAGDVESYCLSRMLRVFIQLCLVSTFWLQRISTPFKLEVTQHFGQRMRYRKQPLLKRPYLN